MAVFILKVNPFIAPSGDWVLWTSSYLCLVLSLCCVHHRGTFTTCRGLSISTKRNYFSFIFTSCHSYIDWDPIPHKNSNLALVTIIERPLWYLKSQEVGIFNGECNPSTKERDMNMPLPIKNKLQVKMHRFVASTLIAMWVWGSMWNMGKLDSIKRGINLTKLSPNIQS